MSVTSHLSGNPDKIFNKPPHRRNDSGELDVFEAARYFSGCNELTYTAAGYENSSFSQKMFRDGRRGGRMSLDLPIRTNVVPLPPPYTAEKTTTTMMKEIKKQRQQPSSPGGRLANFLNSIFNQSSSKKKKKSKNPMKQNEDVHQEISGRKRRSSLSTLIDSKSSSSSSNNIISGFRAPNCSVETPNKNYKEIKSFLDHHQKRVAANSSKNNQILMRKVIKDDEVDEGGESDSSSDLFELRIYDSDCYYSSSGLPVYETTNIHTINRPSPHIITPLSSNSIN